MVKKVTKKGSPGRDASVLPAGMQTITYYTGAGNTTSHRVSIDVRPEENHTRILSTNYDIVGTVKSIRRHDVLRVLRGLKRKELIDQELSEILTTDTERQPDEDLGKKN